MQCLDLRASSLLARSRSNLTGISRECLLFHTVWELYIQGTSDKDNSDTGLGLKVVFCVLGQN